MPEWARALNTGFLRQPAVSDEETADRLSYVDLGRTLGAFDGGRCVGTFRSFRQEITAVGGAPVVADAISNVAVLPTHRRRGLLSGMMATDLAAAKKRGDTVATLISAEYPIYGRYGFGPATWGTDWSVDIARAALDRRWSGPEGGARVDLVDGTEVLKHGPELYERFRAAQPGAVTRDERWWRVTTGVTKQARNPFVDPFHVLYRSASGEVEGLLTYRVDEHWNDAKQPQNTAVVRDLIALTPSAERALWTYICSVDWITSVTAERRAPDDVLPLLMGDPRSAVPTTQADFLWVRILDVVAALEARTYAVPGSLVLDVADRGGFTGGRFRLDAEEHGARCAPTADSADLTLDVADLATLWLGDESAVRLAALGRVHEERPGAAATADVLFRTSRRPWCPDSF
ncbi:GNAT family N-acetyltransferase [Streptomyces tsukubensis]|uniref:GNAT family N-acetyltransferase n=2 Tax=Streptomyces tsukubensis TaxID=83656 RepID=A0A1V4A9K2_9ACTN|nr:GNAT family N-acetyltransferase [Streptomyces tsukubensis]